MFSFHPHGLRTEPADGRLHFKYRLVNLYVSMKGQYTDGEFRLSTCNTPGRLAYHG